MRLKLFTLVFLLTSQTVYAQSVASPGLDDLAWISGTWVSGSPEDTQTEVIWSERRGDGYVGTWRTISGNELAAYEMLTLVQRPTGIEYRFDLFRESSDFVSPATNRFLLEEARDGYARFRHTEQNASLTFVRDEEGRLTGTWIDHDTDESFEGYRVTRQR